MATEATEVVFLRLPHGTVKRLRHLAHAESLRQETDVTWAAMIRELVETVLHERERGDGGSRKQRKVGRQ